jgi:hypothetical protein
VNTIRLTGAGVRIEDVVAVARERRQVEIAPAVLERLAKAREVLDRAAAGRQKIYGLNTGLGANLGTSVTGDASAFQRQLLEGRSGAVGDLLPTDIVVEASRLPQPEPLLKTEWIKRGALVVPYGTMSAVELSLTDIMDKIVVDDWGQCKSGKFGALRAHVETGRLSETTLHAELGQIVAGHRPGRDSDDETILFWHRGLSLSDIALGKAMLEKAAANGIGQRLRFA